MYCKECGSDEHTTAEHAEAKGWHKSDGDRAGMEFEDNQEPDMQDQDFDADDYETKADDADDGNYGFDPDKHGSEPLGSQLVRRTHDSLATIMEEVDDALKLVENKKVKAKLERLLSDMESAMTDLESLHGSEYEDLEPLGEPASEDEGVGEQDEDDLGPEAHLGDLEDGGEDGKELEEPTETADSNDEEPIAEGEVVEGMRTKVMAKSLANVFAKQEAELSKCAADVSYLTKVIGNGIV